MSRRRLCVSLFAFVAVGLVASLAWALGEKLGQSKDELKLTYDLEVHDHGTGRVTAVLKIADEGRLKPLDSVDLVIPGSDKTGYSDLSVSLATSKEDGKTVARAHLKKELAERAELQLKTHAMDGKSSPRTWYFYAISLAEHMPPANKAAD
jgi:hypothetical protein